MKEIDFGVIVSSPFLRCLQTALILAEKFDAKVLIDQELGEVMGPPVFETKPPLPPRPWSNLTLDREVVVDHLWVHVFSRIFVKFGCGEKLQSLYGIAWHKWQKSSVSKQTLAPHTLGYTSKGEDEMR